MTRMSAIPELGAKTAKAYGRRTGAAFGSFLPLLFLPRAALASFFSGEALDTAADVLTIIVLILVPVVGIAAFWLVHILPEKIAEKRNHPQKEAIQTLCLLSLVFGGLLWPLAWLWAYTKPVMHKLAYGTDKHEDYHKEQEEAAQKEIEGVQREMEALEQRTPRPEEVKKLRERLAALEAKLPRASAGGLR